MKQTAPMLYASAQLNVSAAGAYSIGASHWSTTFLVTDIIERGEISWIYRSHQLYIGYVIVFE